MRCRVPVDLKCATETTFFAPSVADHDENVRALALEGISSVLRSGDHDAGLLLLWPQLPVNMLDAHVDFKSLICSRCRCNFAMCPCSTMNLLTLWGIDVPNPGLVAQAARRQSLRSIPTS